MAFFDDLGKKLSQAGQVTMQKTKEVSGVVKLNTMISDEEKRIKKAKAQIGELYVEMHPEDYDEAFKDMFHEIREAEKRIKEYESQKETLRGAVKCPKCGSSVAIGSAFCGYCGAPMEQASDIVSEDAVPAETETASVEADVAESQQEIETEVGSTLS